MTNVKEVQEQIDLYADKITGITIDRGFGDGEEFFYITDCAVNKDGNRVLITNSEDFLDAEFLSTCEYIKFHLSDEVVIKKDNPTYSFTVKKSEIKQAVNLLMDVYDRLCEVAEVPSCIDTPNGVLKEKVWQLKKRIQGIAVTKNLVLTGTCAIIE